MDEQKILKIKTKIFRLHFLLTEPESDDIIQQSFEQFKFCFRDVFDYLADYLKSVFEVKLPSDNEIIISAFKNKLITELFSKSLKVMENDYQSLVASKKSPEIFARIKSDYAQYLQLIYDMLERMGQDIEDAEGM